jgi:hypothetical protein
MSGAKRAPSLIDRPVGLAHAVETTVWFVAPTRHRRSFHRAAGGAVGFRPGGQGRRAPGPEIRRIDGGAEIGPAGTGPQVRVIPPV